jgi:deoxyribonuclease IV
VLFGGHFSGGVKKALDNAAAVDAEAVQLFVQSPRAWRFPQHDPADLARFRARREELGIGAVAVHALYLVNLASPDEEMYAKSVATMRDTVDAACAIGADAVVFHVGSHLGSGFEAGLERVVPALELVLERCAGDTWLCLENSAGAGGTIGRSVDELAVLVERLGRHPRAGICLDSCHLWVSGVDVTDRGALDACIDEIEERIGLDRLRALHVNDAAAPLGSNRDRHANLGEGELGEELGVFLGHPKLQGLPTIL